ncbi:MAG: nicotinate (nicotinamide) nucleotide adenylyltransferase [Chitinophagaceae bacterium]
MRIGLYFGSFNPIHIGHLIIASYVAEHSKVDKVWFVVSPQNPLKLSNTLLNEYDRLHLVTLAIEDDDRFRVSDIEFKLPKPSYTIDTLTHLEEKYPQHDFSIIMGSDSYCNIEKWKNYELLVKKYPILVYKRPKYDIVENAYNATMLEAPIIDISSTLIRKLIKEKKNFKYLLSDSVYKELVNNQYYK